MSCKNCKCPQCNPTTIIYSCSDLAQLVKESKRGNFSNDQDGLEHLEFFICAQGRREFFIWSLIYQQPSVKDFILCFEDLLLKSHPNKEIEISWLDFIDLVLFMIIKDEKTRDLITSALMMM